MLLTRSPLIHPASWASAFDLHVLSTPPAFVLSQDQTLRTKTKTLKPRKTNQKQASNPNQKHSKTKNRHKTKTNKHTIEFTNNTHTIEDTGESAHFRKVFRAKFPRPSVSLRSLPFGATRRTLRTCLPIVKSRRSGPLNTHFRNIPRFSAEFSARSDQFSTIFMRQNTECRTKCAPRRASNRALHACYLDL